MQAKAKLWIERKGKTFLAQGRVTLLERLDKSGSISEAARSMNMSYRRAWLLINSINQALTKPMVVTCTGGKKGGGAKLTPHGKKAILMFQKLQKELHRFLKRQTKKIKVNP